MKHRVVASACIAAALALLCAAGLRAAEKRPVAVVFDFEAPFDQKGKNDWARWTGTIFRGHLARRAAYTTIDNVSFDEAVEMAGFKPTLKTPLEKVAAVMRNNLAADVAIWGRITRPKKEFYELHVKAVELVDGKPQLVLNEKYVCNGRHAIRPAVDLALDQLLGVEPEPEVDLMATDEWKTRPNLVKNGGFEEGKHTPLFWEPMDGLSTFWVADVSPDGKCVLFDTDVEWDQYNAWHAEFKMGKGKPASQAPKPKRGTHYNSIGGTAGAHIYSDYVAIEQGATYRFDCDFLGPASNCKVFIKGYAEFKGEFGFEGQRREVYRAPVWMHNEKTPNKWTHFARLFHPTQALAILGFESDFDNGKTGEMLRTALLKALKEKHDLIISDADLGSQAVKRAKLTLTPDVPRTEIALLMRKTYGRGQALWGQITRGKDGKLKLDLLGMDVRKETMTKFFHDEWKLGTALDVDALAERAATRIIELARPVRWLRVKLDCYWPATKYWFDNIRLTREPPAPAGPHEE